MLISNIAIDCLRSVLISQVVATKLDETRPLLVFHIEGLFLINMVLSVQFQKR